MNNDRIPLRVEDLRGGDVVTLTCERCGLMCQMKAEAVLNAARPYRLLTDFGKAHACGRCFRLGAFVSLTGEDL